MLRSEHARTTYLLKRPSDTLAFASSRSQLLPFACRHTMHELMGIGYRRMGTDQQDATQELDE